VGRREDKACNCPSAKPSKAGEGTTCHPYRINHEAAAQKGNETFFAAATFPDLAVWRTGKTGQAQTNLFSANERTGRSRKRGLAMRALLRGISHKKSMGKARRTRNEYHGNLSCPVSERKPTFLTLRELVAKLIRLTENDYHSPETQALFHEIWRRV
jgi:hypothetical protein